MLARELQCKFVSFGDFVRQEAVQKGIVNATRADLQNLGQNLVKENVRGFCRSVLETVNFLPGEQIVIDGVRHKEVLDTISEMAHDQPMKVVYLSASDTTRRRRAPHGLDLALIDSHEVESEVEQDIKLMADLIIETEGDERSAFQVLLDRIRPDVMATNGKS
jgi:RNase adaptor protein for sRNA GlmZ degradation